MKAWTGLSCATVAACVAAAGVAAGTASASVLVVSTDPAARVSDVVTKLTATGRIGGGVASFDAARFTPTVEQLLAYDSVLVFGEPQFKDATTLGNNLASYVDAGRVVVEAAFCGGSRGVFSPQGRWQSGYSPYNGTNTTAGSYLTPVAKVSGTPMLTGVVSFNSGSGGYHNQVTVRTDVTLVANWSNGTPLIAQRFVGTGQVIGLNLYPPSASAFNDGWRGTDGGRLMANALMQNAPEPGTAALVLLSMLPMAGRPRWIRRRRVRKMPAA